MFEEGAADLQQAPKHPGPPEMTEAIPMDLWGVSWGGRDRLKIMGKIGQLECSSMTTPYLIRWFVIVKSFSLFNASLRGGGGGPETNSEDSRIYNFESIRNK